jgi:hypothetical protein
MTYTYILSGIVHPERAYSELDNTIHATIQNESIKLDGTISISIIKSQLTVGVVSETKITDLETLKNVALDMVNGIVDIMAVHNYVAYMPEIKSISSPEINMYKVYSVSMHGLTPENVEEKGVEIGAALKAFTEDHYLPLAFNNVKQSILIPNDTGFYCYRSIECLLNSLSEKFSLDKKAAIDKLNADLNLSKKCLETLRTYGGPARHGKPVSISGEERTTLISIASQIVQRFMSCYISGHNSPAEALTLELP